MIRASDLWMLPLTEAAEGIAEGRFTPDDLVASVLERIDSVESNLLAFVSVDAEGARQQARRLTRELDSKAPRGPLHGIPIAVKDIFDLAGYPTRRGSRAFAETPAAQADAESIRSLRSAGAIVIGKTVTHEVACGVYSPPTKNPWNPEYCCGGSSGGSAAAVAAGEVFAATGSDTGGSIRIPAALCGIVGIKPTYSSVSRLGVAALSWSLDHVGPIGRSVEDVAIALDGMGWSSLESSRRVWPLPHLELWQVSIGIIDELAEDAEHDVAEAFSEACAALQAAGATMRHISLRDVGDCLDVEFAIVMAEAGAYYADVLRTRPEQLSEEVRVLFEAGSVLPSSTYLDAQRLRHRLSRAVGNLFGREGLDFLCAPTIPVTGYRPSETSFTSGGRSGTITDAVVKATAPFNLTGVPAVSVPMGVSSIGQPMGLQLAAPAFEEPRLLAAARAYERVSEWRHVARAPLVRN